MKIEDIKVIPYTPEERQAIETTLHRYFGPDSLTMENARTDMPQADIILFPPTEELPYWKLATVGMGAYLMADHQLVEGIPARSELIMAVEPDWLDPGIIFDESDEDYEMKYVWPFNILARLSIEPALNQDFHGMTTMYDFGKLDENTELSHILLGYLHDLPDDEQGIAYLPNGEPVAFLQVIPLYEDEMNYYTNLEDIDDKVDFINTVPHILNPGRESLVRKLSF